MHSQGRDGAGQVANVLGHLFVLPVGGSAQVEHGQDQIGVPQGLKCFSVHVLTQFVKRVVQAGGIDKDNLGLWKRKDAQLAPAGHLRAR